MVMPSASLTLSDKILIRMASVVLFLVSAFWYGHEKIRSVGICCFPLAFALFCKHSRPFASAETRAQVRREREEQEAQQKRLQSNNELCFYEDPLDEPAFADRCLVWSVAQLFCVASGLFNYYPNIIIKGALVFHVLMTVQDSVETRPMVLHREELKRKRDERLRLESAHFWKFFLPKAIWRLLGYEAIVKKATSHNSPQQQPNDKPKTKKSKVRTTRSLVSKKGKRETATEDLIWGTLQIAFVVLDFTAKQTIGTAFLVYLCTLLEDVLAPFVVASKGSGSETDTPPKKKKIPWVKISWILLCLYLNGKWFLAPS